MERLYKNLKIMIWILAFAVLIVGAKVLYDRLSAQMEAPPLVAETTQEAGKEDSKVLAPDFTVYDLEGSAFRLSDFRGKPVVLNFWASWCGPCKSEMPEFQSFWETYGEQIHFLVVNLTDGYQETLESASSYIEKGGYTFPVYYDTDMEAAMAYGVNAVPVTYFIDEEGALVTAAQGALNASRFQQGIDLLLGQ